MRSTFLGFETARKSLAASQKNIDITGHNISNMGTPGYTRQRVDLLSMTSSGLYRIGASNTTFAGQGVIMTGVAQMRDVFLDKRFRDAYGESGASTITTGILTDVRQIMDETTTEGITAAIKNLEAEFIRFQANPDKLENGNIVLTAGKTLTQVFRQYDAKLKAAQEQNSYEFEVAIKDANAIMAKLAGLNDQIKNESLYGSSSGPGGDRVSGVYGPNELMDDRNLLIDQLSRLGDVTTEPMPDGTVNVYFAGKKVIEGQKYDQLVFKQDTVDKSYGLTFQSGDAVSLKSGAIKGYKDMLNGHGFFASGGNQTGEQGIPYYQKTIDRLAYEFASVMNSVSTQVDPVTGERSEIKLFDSIDGLEINSGNIKITDEWMKDPLLFKKAVKSDGSLDTTPGQTYADAINSKDKKVDFGQFEGNFWEYTQFMGNKINQQLSFSSGKQEADDQVAISILQRKDEISAVSLDEEGANLMNYQKVYAASGRLMTAMDEALDIIINKMGLVGR